MQDRINDNIVTDYVGTFSPKFIFNFRFGLARFDNVEASASNGQIDPGALGITIRAAADSFQESVCRDLTFRESPIF
ncbi:MAG: hypothetical protein HC846_09410 [Blastocatellia bacterium]|nr:hypothetical protein [Blastocatellia bacterium]